MLQPPWATSQTFSSVPYSKACPLEERLQRLEETLGLEKGYAKSNTTKQA